MKRIAPILIVLLLISSPAWCSISRINSWQPSTWYTSSATVNTSMYGSAAVGDVYVMPWTYTGTASPTTGFDGWSVLGEAHNDTFHTITQVWLKVVTAADVGKTYNFAWNATANPAGGIIAFRGVNNSAPVDAFSFHNNGSGSTVTADSITPAGGDALVWIAGGYLAANQRFNPPSGYSGGLTIIKQSNTWAETAAMVIGVPAQPTGPVTGSSQYFSDLWETALISLTAGGAPPPTAAPTSTGSPIPTATQTSYMPPGPTSTPTKTGTPVQTPPSTWTPRPTNTPVPTAAQTSTPVGTIFPTPTARPTAPDPGFGINSAPDSPSGSAFYPNCQFGSFKDNTDYPSNPNLFVGPRDFKCWNVVYEPSMPANGWTGANIPCSLSALYVADGPGVNGAAFNSKQIAVGTYTTTSRKANPALNIPNSYIQRIYSNAGVNLQCFYGFVGNNQELQMTVWLKNIRPGADPFPYISQATVNLIPFKNNNDVAPPVAGACNMLGKEITKSDSLRGKGGPLIYPLRYLAGWTDGGTQPPSATSVRFLVTTADADINAAVAQTYFLGNKCAGGYTNPVISLQLGWQHRAYNHMHLTWDSGHANKVQDALHGCQHYVPSYEWTQGWCDMQLSYGIAPGFAVNGPPTAQNGCGVAAYPPACGYDTLGPLTPNLNTSANGGQTATMTIVASVQPDNGSYSIGQAPTVAKYATNINGSNSLAKTKYPMMLGMWTDQRPIGQLGGLSQHPTDPGRNKCCLPRDSGGNLTYNAYNPHFWQVDYHGGGSGPWNPADDLRNGIIPGIGAVCCQGWEDFRYVGGSRPTGMLAWASNLYQIMLGEKMQGGIVWDPLGAEFTDAIEYVGPPAAKQTTNNSDGMAQNGYTGDNQCEITPHFPNSAPYTSSPSTYNVGITYALPKELGFKTGGTTNPSCDGDNNTLKETFATLCGGACDGIAPHIKVGTLMNASGFHVSGNTMTRYNPDTYFCSSAEGQQAWRNIKTRMDLMYYYGARMFYLDAIAGDPMSTPCLMQQLYNTYGHIGPAGDNRNVLLLPEEKAMIDYSYSIGFDDTRNYYSCDSNNCVNMWSTIYPWESTFSQHARWLYPGPTTFPLASPGWPPQGEAGWAPNVPGKKAPLPRSVISIARDTLPHERLDVCPGGPSQPCNSPHGMVLWQQLEDDVRRGSIIMYSPGNFSAETVTGDIYKSANHDNPAVPVIW